ncbi:hypothetical protein [Chryseobacterium sp. CH21]|uniref:hypothetical protein n=1 Tax=Chryseobacterium sp. CH21 TaxID=713556 RepID=UPI0013E9872B|nr:hypothetical protein [Chryseobacterium sp. CH21]
MKKLYQLTCLGFFISLIFFPDFVFAQKIEDILATPVSQKNGTKENPSLAKNNFFYRQ